VANGLRSHSFSKEVSLLIFEIVIHGLDVSNTEILANLNSVSILCSCASGCGHEHKHRCGDGHVDRSPRAAARRQQPNNAIMLNTCSVLVHIV